MLDFLAETAAIMDVRRGRTLTRSDLAALSMARSGELAAAGLSTGGRVGFCHADAAALLVDLFAAWRIGATAVPLSASLLPAERERYAERYALQLWVSETPLATIASLLPAHLDRPAGQPAPAVTPGSAGLDTPALILSTSGTTAQPKGVVLTHRAVLARLCLNAERIGAASLERTLAMLPLHFGHGLIGNALSPLFAGQTLVLWTEPGIADYADLGPLIDRHAITFLSSVPALWRIALKMSPPPSRGSLRRIHVGSEPLPGDLWRSIARWSGDRPVFNMYGISEAANWICGADGADCGFIQGSVGSPWGGAARIRDDETGALMSQGRGEVLVATPGLMSGYFADEAASAAALVGGWLRTGDIGEIDERGLLRILGRLKYQINRGGLKISAEEIDELLRGHADVEDVCAFGLPDPVAGEVVAAAVVTRTGAAFDAGALRRWCAERVRPEAVPHTILRVEAIPRSERGKVRRDAARDHALASKLGQTA